MTAILKEDPPNLPVAERHIPPALERIVDRCLEKSPAARFQSRGGPRVRARVAVVTLRSHGDRCGAAGREPHARFTRAACVDTAAGLGLALAITSAVAVPHLRETAPVEQSVQFEIRLPAGASPVAQAPIEISPDGQQVLFGAFVQGISALWVRSLSGLEARRLPGTEGAAYPFWSHDSRSVAFFAGTEG